MNDSVYPDAEQIVDYILMMQEYLVPILYYGTSEDIERGTVLYCEEPEFIVIHPDTVGELSEKLAGHRRLRHLRDRPLDPDDLKTFMPTPFELPEGDSWRWIMRFR